MPIYRRELPELELAILKHNLEVLAAHRFVFVAPHSLDMSRVMEQVDISRHELLRVSDEWMGEGKGVGGYNHMMTSPDFYALFTDTDYILICQSDAYIFRDELLAWCNKGYSYIGAPWPMKRITRTWMLPFARTYLRLLHLLRADKSTIHREQVYLRIGNGGLSLRHVESCLRAATKHSSRAKLFNGKGSTFYNEDIFWALLPHDMRYPSVGEAIRFSLDSAPWIGFEMAQKNLPFGCHGLTNDRYYEFWKEYLTL